MPAPTYHGHAFAQLPLTYHWRRGLHDLGTHITAGMRAQAQGMTAHEWPLDRLLDQATTPHCVGFAWATWGNCLPVDAEYGDFDAHRLYYEAVAIGGAPGSEEGAETEWGAKAMVARRRLQEFAWASSIDDIVTWLLVAGPLVTGLLWTTGMESPDTGGLMHATGTVLGGHATCWIGVDKERGRLKVANSWGPRWGQGGCAEFSLDDMAKMLAQRGDCCTALEVEPGSTPAPAPKGCLSFFR